MGLDATRREVPAILRREIVTTILNYSTAGRYVARASRPRCDLRIGGKCSTWIEASRTAMMRIGEEFIRASMGGKSYDRYKSEE
ncbi:hypothetical protein SBA2_10139 [Acidobacteriia bacterium SbA2]|nr:hypothetical protein SBA2_10139 [Acidobacteriia bacterium SbA2]